jgi:mannitol-specific phosphotransferase system IIBC component
MAKRKRKSKGNNSTLMMISVLIILAIISVVIAWFVLYSDETKTESTETVTSEQVEEKEEVRQENKDVKTALEGTWVSNYDGAMLTVKGLDFTLDQPSVDGSGQIKGTLKIDNANVTFSNTNGIEKCIGKKGQYSFSFEKDELNLKLIKDPCESRAEKMAAGWFRL